jgi:hypothetical protein
MTEMLNDVTTGNNVTSRLVDNGFTLVFNTCFESTVCRSLLIDAFSEVNNGRLSISAAGGHRKVAI